MRLAAARSTGYQSNRHAMPSNPRSTIYNPQSLALDISSDVKGWPPGHARMPAKRRQERPPS